MNTYKSPVAGFTSASHPAAVAACTAFNPNDAPPSSRAPATLRLAALRATRLFLFTCLAAFICLSGAGISSAQAQTYTTSGRHILKNGVPWAGGGTNAWDAWGLARTTGYPVKIRRCNLTNMSGRAILRTDSGQKPSIQEVVENARADGAIAILSFHGWFDDTAMTGSEPQTNSWYTNGQFASRLQQIASAFASQSDVWFDPWNEPNFSSQGNWQQTADTIYNAVRAVSSNLILIPCNGWDHDTSNYVNGTAWKSNKSNVVATIHAYNAWTSQSYATNRAWFQETLDAGWPIIVGEIGPDEWVSDISRTAQAAVDLNITTLGWTWQDGGGAGGLSFFNQSWQITSWGNLWLNTWMPQFVSPPASGPYGGTARAIPGTVQAEDYDVGGQGVAYNDSDTSNNGGAYRSEGVDIETCTEGGYDVGWTGAGEWMKYTVNVASSGTYNVTFRVSSGASGGSFHLENQSGTNISGAASVGATGNWQTFTNVTKSVSLSAGTQTLRFVCDSGGFNLNSISFASTAPIANGTYYLTPACATGARLDAAGGGTTNGTNVQIWGYVANNSNQKWVLTNTGGNTYIIASKNATNMVLDCYGAGTTNGTNVQLWTDGGGLNQRWNITALGGGKYKIVPAHAPGMALDVNGAGTANGTNVQLWQDSAATNTAQQWSFTSTP